MLLANRINAANKAHVPDFGPAIGATLASVMQR